MKKLLLTGLAALTALSLAACGGGTPTGTQSSAPGTDASSAAAPSASTDEKIGEGQTLTVWIMEGTNPDATAFFDEVTAAFKEQTGADLDIQMVPWASAKEKFTTAIAGGTTPDVAEVGTTWTPEFADAGALVSLSEMVAADGLDGDLVEGLVNAGTLDGELYGMP